MKKTIFGIIISFSLILVAAISTQACSNGSNDNVTIKGAGH